MFCHFLASRNYSKWRLQHFSLCSWKSAHRRVSAREVALYTWRRLKRCEYACASFDVSFKAPFNVFYGRKMCHKDCDEKLLWLTWSKSSCKLLTYEGSFLLVLVPKIYCFPGPKVKRFCREKKVLIGAKYWHRHHIFLSVVYISFQHEKHSVLDNHNDD